MALICALSSEVPEQAVVSPVSGYVFEKRLIVKYLNENGNVDPMNQQPLGADQLIDVKVSSGSSGPGSAAGGIVKPKPPSATSIPALLKSMQDEWDSVMLHSFTLRQQLQTARQELSHALYQHDAACRVIARLNKELAAAREALATLKPYASQAQPMEVTSSNGTTNGVGDQTASSHTNGGTASAGQQQQQQLVEQGISEEVAQKLQDKSTVLTQMRKQKGKKIPEDLASIDDIKSYKCVSSHTGLHSASVTGITTLDIQQNDSTHVVTGGNDKTAVVFNASSEQIVATLKGHTKRLTKVIYHPEEDTIITASADATIRTWSVPSGQQTQVLKVHEASVTGISLHPLGDYLLSCSTDEHWAFSDIRTGRMLIKMSSSGEDASPPVALTCAQFHPDGLIFGTGTSDALVKIWDLKSKSNLANFPGHTAAITCLAFSENGYYLATGGEDSCVKLWDLRKLKNFKTIELDAKYEIRDVAFDFSGSYLACAGTDVRVYHTKQWDTVHTFAEHTASATGVRFGNLAKTLVTCSLDKSIKFYSL